MDQCRRKTSSNLPYLCPREEVVGGERQSFLAWGMSLYKGIMQKAHATPRKEGPDQEGLQHTMARKDHTTPSPGTLCIMVSGPPLLPYHFKAAGLRLKVFWYCGIIVELGSSLVSYHGSFSYFVIHLSY